MKLFSFKRSQSLQTNNLQTIDAHTLKQWLDQQTAIAVDVREANEYAEGHIPSATLVPLSSFDASKLPSPQNQKVVLYCRSGKRSAMAAQKLFNDGYQEVIHLGNGIIGWAEAGYPVQVR
jgi:rhodanese-related sulfurtransferase